MKQLSKAKKLPILLFAIILLIAVMAGTALADNESAGDEPTGSTSHNYITNMAFCEHMASGILNPGLSFDPDVTEYTVTLPDVCTLPQLWLKLSDKCQTIDNLYMKVTADATGKQIVEKLLPMGNASSEWSTKTLISITSSAPIGSVSNFTITIGLKTDNVYSETDTYKLTIKRRAVLNTFSASLADGTALTFTPVFQTVAAKNTLVSDYTVVVPTGTETLKLKIAPFSTTKSKNMAKLVINGQDVAWASDNMYEIDLTQYTPDANDVITIPFELAYTGTAGTGEGTTYTLKVVMKDVMPIITQQPTATVTCGKGDDITLSVGAQLPGDDGTLSYQWCTGSSEANVRPIDGATEATYTIPTTYASGTRYYCLVSNTVDGIKYTVTSTASDVTVQLTYIDPAVITSFKASGTESMEGEKTVSLSVKIEYPDLFVDYPTIKWYRNNTDSTEGGTLIGSSYHTSGGECSFSPPGESAGTYYYYCEVILNKSSYVEYDFDVTSVTTKSTFTLPITFKTYSSIIELNGSGTEEQPYLIKSYDDLLHIKALVKSGYSLGGQYFKLVTNLELPADWIPIGEVKGTDTWFDYGDWRNAPVDQYKVTGKGTNLLPFSGIFDGGGYQITVAEGGLPLFGVVRDATIKNLDIYGKKIAGNGLIENYFVDYGLDGNYNTGCPQTALIENVTLKEGSSTKYSGFISGFASGANTVIIRNCKVEKNVTIGYDKDMEEIGSFGGYFNGIVQNCVSYADVYGTDCVGGLVGAKGQSMGSCSISNCEFYGTVNATGRYSGGILGSGYWSSSAPNTPVASVNNCLVVATINGGEYVGGIFGGEPSCENCWANGKGGIRDNVFYGTITATGEYKGSIIGFMKSANENQSVTNNYYLDTCGAEDAIGYIDIFDNFDNSKSGFAATAVQMKNNTVVDKLNSSETGYRNWTQGQDYPVHSDKAVAYSLEISGDYQTEYYTGDALNFDGMTLTAYWSDGSVTNPDIDDIKISGHNKKVRGIQTITLTYGASSAEIKVTVLKKPSSNSNTITVAFTLLGDSVHGDPTDVTGTHTLTDNNLQAWIEKTYYTVDLNATVWDVIEKALSDNDMTCSNPSGNYIESITRNGVTLGEFSNGNLSGWMYTLNDTHPLLGVSEQFLNNGDEIVFHYTDNYTIEEGSDKWNDVGSSYDSANDVVQLINKIGTVSKDSGAAIKDARDAYDKLSDEQKLKVTNYDKLTAAEKAFADLNKTAGDTFIDVKGHWAEEAINFVVERGLFNGTSATTFEPDTAMNRAMLVTVIWRLEGEPEAEKNSSFTDIDNNDYYAKAVAWATANGIVNGYSNTEFAPNDMVSREQLAAILYRYAKFKGFDVSATAELNAFSDYNQISDYAVDSIQWACGANIINGRSADTLAPSGDSTRAEVATMLMRFIQNIIK